MRRVVETKEGEFEALLGKKVLLMCANYFYYGTLTGVNKTRVELTDPSIVYETGTWSAATWSSAQALPSKVACVRIAFIESFFEVAR